MTQNPFNHRMAHAGKTWLARLGFIGALSALAFAAGTHVDTSTATAQTRTDPPSRVEADDYIVTLATNGTYSVGKQGNVTLKLVPKAPFKVNQDFPIKFKLSDPPGDLVMSKKKLDKSDATLTESSAVFSVPFTASRAGKYTISGKLHFSVCTPSKCNTHNVDISIKVDVAAAP